MAAESEDKGASPPPPGRATRPRDSVNYNYSSLRVLTSPAQPAREAPSISIAKLRQGSIAPVSRGLAWAGAGAGAGTSASVAAAVPEVEMDVIQSTEDINEGQDDGEQGDEASAPEQGAPAASKIEAMLDADLPTDEEVARAAASRRNPPRKGDARGVGMNLNILATAGIHPLPPPAKRRRRRTEGCGKAPVAASDSDSGSDSEDVRADLGNQEEYNVECGREIPKEDTKYAADPRADSVTFFDSVTMDRDDSDPLVASEPRVTYRVGGTALIRWIRDDPHEPEGPGKDLSLLRILAIHRCNETGRAYIVPQWGRCWGDMIRPYDHHGPDPPPDAFMRSRREVFWEAQESAEDPGRRLLSELGLWGERQLVVNLVRPCEVRHWQEFASEAERARYEAQQDCWWSRYTCTPPHLGKLRFEALPPPFAAAPAPLRVQRAGGRPTLMDGFCGSGSTGHAGRDAGFNVTFCFDQDLEAFTAVVQNLPEVAARCRHNLSLEQVLAGVKEQRLTGTDLHLGLPRRGDIDVLHLSPPCQCLSQLNAHVGLDRFQHQLLPLLGQVCELIEELRPKFVSIEEVPRFLVCPMKRVQHTKRAKHDQDDDDEADVEVKLEGEELVQAGGEAGPSTLPAADRAAAQEKHREAELAKREREVCTVRCWLYVIPRLLVAGYQVDMRMLNAAHYGVPQNRQRLFVVAAQVGYQLPCFPKPQYHANTRGFPLADDTAVQQLVPNWSSLIMASQASQGLPNAVTAAEALSDLPRMEIAGAGGQCRRHVGGTWQPHNPAKVGKFVVLHARKGLDATDQGRLLLDHRIVGNSMPDQEAPWNDPLPTITCADDKRLSKMRHPLEARSLTLLERKRGQSMPDHFRQEGSLVSQQRQVGNAVPWLLARALMAELYQAATGQAAQQLPNLKGWCAVPGVQPQAQQQQQLAQQRQQELEREEAGADVDEVELAVDSPQESPALDRPGPSRRRLGAAGRVLQRPGTAPQDRPASPREVLLPGRRGKPPMLNATMQQYLSASPPRPAPPAPGTNGVSGSGSGTGSVATAVSPAVQQMQSPRVEAAQQQQQVQAEPEVIDLTMSE